MEFHWVPLISIGFFTESHGLNHMALIGNSLDLLGSGWKNLMGPIGYSLDLLGSGWKNLMGPILFPLDLNGSD